MTYCWLVSTRWKNKQWVGEADQDLEVSSMESNGPWHWTNSCSLAKDTPHPSHTGLRRGSTTGDRDHKEKTQDGEKNLAGCLPTLKRGPNYTYTCGNPGCTYKPTTPSAFFFFLNNQEGHQRVVVVYHMRNKTHMARYIEPNCFHHLGLHSTLNKQTKSKSYLIINESHLSWMLNGQCKIA